MVDSSAFPWGEGCVEAMNGVMSRQVKWVVMRIPEGKDSGCDLEF